MRVFRIVLACVAGAAVIAFAVTKITGCDRTIAALLLAAAVCLATANLVMSILRWIRSKEKPL